MKYKHQASIIGAGGKIIGRMPKDSIKRVRANSAGVAVDTRKGKTMVWFWRLPFTVARYS
jgi:muconolactone delta-isomerase